MIQFPGLSPVRARGSARRLKILGKVPNIFGRVARARPSFAGGFAICLFFLACRTWALAEEREPLSRVAEGQALALELRDQAPPEDSTARGQLKMRDAKGVRREWEVKAATIRGTNDWRNIYEASNAKGVWERLTVLHQPGRTNEYLLERSDPADEARRNSLVPPGELMRPFAAGDFWLADLGLEFFHWPRQRIVTDVRRNMRMGRACKMLESINLEPVKGGYARVLSWVDLEYNGLICAEAYDGKGDLLKVFAIKKMEKVEGQWTLQEMEIRNEKLNSRTRLEFEIGK